MGRPLETFEVRVEVIRNNSKHYEIVPYLKGMWVFDKIIKMFHVDAKDGKTAMRICEKHGRPLTSRKVKDRDGAIEHLQLFQEHIEIPYENAIAMDDMIWRKKKKRAERINNLQKDKKGVA